MALQQEPLPTRCSSCQAGILTPSLDQNSDVLHFVLLGTASLSRPQGRGHGHPCRRSRDRYKHGARHEKEASDIPMEDFFPCDITFEHDGRTFTVTVNVEPAPEGMGGTIVS